MLLGRILLAVLLAVRIWCDADDVRDFSEDAELFDCQSIPPKRIPAALVGDGICDCCNGNDERPTSGDEQGVSCPNTCAAELQDATAKLSAFVHAHEQGASAAQALLRGTTQRRTQAVRDLASQHQQAAAEAEALHQQYVQRHQQLSSMSTRPSQKQIAAVNRLAAQTQRALDESATKRTQSQATYGHQNKWVLALGACASSVALSEKVSKGGSSTSIPKRYIYTVCFGDNVTQTEYLPDEWIREDRASKGLAHEIVTGPDGTVHVDNRTLGGTFVLGRWTGYLPLQAFGDHLWALATRFPGVTEAGLKVPQSTLRLVKGGPESAAMLYESSEQCRSENVVTTRKVYVFHVCPGTSPESLAAIAAFSTDFPRMPLRFSQFNWNSPLAEQSTLTWFHGVAHVHEDGLCAYKIYVSTVLACSTSAAKLGRQAIALLQNASASP